MKFNIPLPARPQALGCNPWDIGLEGFACEGKLNGWRGLYDQQKGIGYNRYGQVASNQRLMRDRLSNCGIKARFIDCELMGMREKQGVGTVVVIDAFDIDNPKPYSERMIDLGHIHVCPLEVPSNSVLRMPRFKQVELREIWEKMKHLNFNGVVWEGFVFKKDRSYPYAKHPSYHTINWLKWRGEND